MRVIQAGSAAVVAALLGDVGLRVAVVGSRRDSRRRGLRDDVDSPGEAGFNENWEVVTARDAADPERWRSLARESPVVAVNLLPAGPLSSEALARIAEHSLALVPEDGRLALLVAPSQLAAPDRTAFRRLLVSASAVEWIVWFEEHNHVAWAIVVVTRRRSSESLVRLVDARGIAHQEALALIETCRGRQGGEIGRTIVLREPLGGSEPWTWDRFSRAYATEEVDAGLLGPLVPLDALIGDLLIGLAVPEQNIVRAPEDQEGLPEGAIPLIQGRSITPDGRLEHPTAFVDARDLPHQRIVQPGDLLFATFARLDHPLRVALAGNDDVPALIASTVLCVRLADSNESRRALLFDYLRSRRFARYLAKRAVQVGDHLRLTAAVLRGARVPAFGDALVEAAGLNAVAERQFRVWTEESSGRLRSFFDAESYDRELPQFLERCRVAGDRVAAAREVDTLDGRVRLRFPHPLALRRELTLQMEHGAERIRKTLECAEHIVRFLAFLGLLNQGAGASGSLKAWTRERGGISLDWGKADSLLREAAAKSAKVPDALALAVPEIASLHEPLSDPRSELSTASRELKAWRDEESHLTRKPPMVVRRASETFAQHLDVMFRAASLLTQTPLVEVEDYERDPATDARRARFTYLVGVSAAFPRRWQSVDEEVTRTHAGLLDVHGEFHTLYPWLIRRTCATCQHRETFVLSRFDNMDARYVAMESGHDLVDPSLAAELTSFVARHSRVEA